MEVDFAFLCDYAENPGKLYALGIGWDNLYAANLPYTQPVVFAVIRIRFTAFEIGEKPFGIRIVDADGNNVVPPVDTTIRVEAPPAGMTERTLTAALGMYGTQFTHYGPHAAIWLLQGTEVKRIPFRVTQPPTTA